ncbi:MAG: hypothetical protein GY703_19855 [Gammaproteobacteria bacterium]|nr:hypothetical protein [Gammaproteobacteria bacterium]
MAAINIERVLSKDGKRFFLYAGVLWTGIALFRLLRKVLGFVLIPVAVLVAFKVYRGDFRKPVTA